MTNKEKVLNIYEDAKIWIMNEGSPYPMFYVQRWSGRFKWHYLARAGKSEEAAWESAWNFIQTEMLRKMES